MTLFIGYDFKKFAKCTKTVAPKLTSKEIRRLYSGYLYPELPLYLKIQKEYRNEQESEM